MDADFIAYYKDNLAFLRQQSEIFATQYPTIAKNLGLSSLECADPFVERVLEGVAFLAARNEQKLDQGSTLLLQDLLTSLAPVLAMPHPALGNFHVSRLQLTQAQSIPQGTQFKTTLKQTICKFSTLFDVDLAPISFADPLQHYQLEDLLQDQYISGEYKSALSFKFDLSAPQALPDDLEVFLNLPELEAGLIAQWLTMNLSAVFVQTEQQIVKLTADLPRAERLPNFATLQAAGLSPETIAQAFYNPATFRATESSGQDIPLKRPFTHALTTDSLEFTSDTSYLASPAAVADSDPSPNSTNNVVPTSLASLDVQSNLEGTASAKQATTYTDYTGFSEQTRVTGLTSSLDAMTNSNSLTQQPDFSESSAASHIQAYQLNHSELAGSLEAAARAAGIGVGIDAQTKVQAEIAAAPLHTHAEKAGGLSAVLSLLLKPNLFTKIMQIGTGMSYVSLYSAYPQLCKYLTLQKLGQALRAIPKLTSGRIIFVFNTLQPKLNLNQMPLLTNVLPMLNLFPKRCSYTQLSLRSYYHLIPERTAPDDFEVISISSIELRGSDHNTTYTALPYFSHSLDPDQIFFIQQRHERAKGTFVPRSPYQKSECFVALCGADFKPLLQPNLNLVAETYCSNADLPLFMKQEHELTTLDESILAKLIDLKLSVEPALVMRSNQQSYALLAYFRLHMHNLLEQSSDRIQLSLQEMLKAYAAPHGDPELELLAQALIGVQKHPQTFRHIHQGIVFFEPGVKLELFFDPEKSGGSSLFFLAQILCAMLQNFAPLNEHCEVYTYTKQGELLAKSDLKTADQNWQYGAAKRELYA